MLFGQLGMLFVFMCVCVSCVFILFLIVDIRNPLEEMVLKIYSTLIFAKSFDLWWVFNRSDVLFRFFIWSSAFFLFSCDIIFFSEAMPFSFFIVVSLGTRFFFYSVFLVRATSFIQVWSTRWCFDHRFLEFGGLNSNSSVTVFNINTYIFY